MNNILKLLAAMCCLATTVNADEFEGALEAYLTDNIAAWASDPTLIEAVRAQNLETAAFDQTRIDELDILWRAQVGAADADMVEKTMSNPAALFLRKQVEATNGAMTEAFLMDAKGLNVAVSHPTSDYWQGDEEKFTQTFSRGEEGIHVGDIELDESTQTVQGQISMTIVDPDTGEAIGALTVGVNLTALM